MRYQLLGAAVLLATTTPCNAQSTAVRLGDASYHTYSIQIGAGEAVLAADELTGDEHIDVLVVMQADQELALLAGDGTGALRMHSRIPSGPEPNSIEVIDLNNDGHNDLLVANHETDYVTLLLGNGKGDFLPAPGSPVKAEVDPHPHVVKAADVNDDGLPDLIVDHRLGNGLLVLRNQGDLQFDKGELVELGGDPYLGMAICDINEDGKPDLLTPNLRNIGIALNSAEGVFTRQPSLDADRPFGVACTDINNDKHMDLVILTDGRSSGVAIARGDGTGKFTEPREVAALPGGGKNVTLGDINGDGITDVLAASWNGAAAIVLGGEPVRSAPVPLSDLPNPWGVLIADLNADGKGDLLITDGQQAKLFVYVSAQ